MVGASSPAALFLLSLLAAFSTALATLSSLLKIGERTLRLDLERASGLQEVLDEPLHGSNDFASLQAMADVFAHRFIGRSLKEWS